jgi:hypothetical protein
MRLWSRSKYEPKVLVVFILFMILTLFVYTKKLRVNHNFIIVYEKNAENFDTNWVVNQNTLQYSSFLLVDRNKQTIYIENLVLFNDNFWYHSVYYRVKCLARHKPTNKVYINNIHKITRVIFMPIDNKTRYLWKIRCKLDSNISNSLNSDWEFTVVHMNDYELSLDFVEYQKPRTFDLTKPKKKAVAHCLHLMRCLNQQRLGQLLDWLSIQKLIGVDKIRMYFYDVDQNVETDIFHRHNKDFIQIVYYPTSFNKVCAKRIRDYDLQPANPVYKQLLIDCERTFDRHFNFSRGYTSNSHERINTNDCYTNFQYEYEYVTNYDFDEIIFPRSYDTRFSIGVSRFVNCLNQTNKQLQYDKSVMNHKSIYDYADILFRKYGKSVTPSLFFAHVIFMPDFDTLQLKKVFFSNRTCTLELVHDSNQTHFELFNAEFKKAKCISKEPLSIAYNFKRLISGKLGHDDRGKSIFNTDLTEAINQHYVTNKKKWFGVSRIKVPLNLGYVSHMRENPERISCNEKMQIDSFFIDYEYFIFIKKNFDFISLPSAASIIS